MIVVCPYILNMALEYSSQSLEDLRTLTVLISTTSNTQPSHVPTM